MEEQKTGNKGTGIRIGLYAVVAFILIYLPSVIVFVSSRQINTAFIRSGSLEKLVAAEACIVRDEKIIRSPVDGKCIFDINEGEKVAANFRIASIMKDSAIELMNQLYDMDLDIIKKQKEKGDVQGIFSEDVVKLDADISRKVADLAMISNSGNYTRAASVKSEIDELVKKKAQIIGDKSTPDTYIKNLISQRDSLASKINSGTNEIISEEPGVVSYVTDGYEEKLTPAGIKNLKPGFIDEVKKAYVRKNGDKNSVSAGSTIAKIIRDMNYYIVMTLDKDAVEGLKADSSIRVRISEINKDLMGVIDYISEEINGKYIVSIRINKSQYETSGLRIVNVELIKNDYQGLKVSLKSLKNVNLSAMTAEVVLVKAGCAETRPVNIKGMNEEYAVIETADIKKGVNLYDIYVINPENIVEGQVIDNG